MDILIINSERILPFAADGCYILTPSMSLVHHCSLKEGKRNSWISCIYGEVKFTMNLLVMNLVMYIYFMEVIYQDSSPKRAFSNLGAS